MNQVTLIGRLGQEPVARSTPNGAKVMSISLATSERRKKGGEYVDHTEWHNLVLFDASAELLVRWSRKGARVGVQGRLQTREYDDKEGIRRRITEVVVDRLHIIDWPERTDSPAGESNGTAPQGGGQRGPRPNSPQGQGTPNRQRTGSPQTGGHQTGGPQTGGAQQYPSYDDDIPF